MHVERTPDSSVTWREDWNLRSNFIPIGRYTDPAFFELETERLWPRVWQIAAREDQLGTAGDFVEYTIGRESILVVRGSDGEIRAFHNTCRHRGRRLASGCGRFDGRTIRCPFHGWTWDLEGKNIHVFLAEDFDPETLSAEEIGLRTCQVDFWGGFVWINMSNDAPSLAEAIGPGTAHLDPAAFERMSALWHKVVRLPVNWKAGLDAFLESYHVPGIHPEYPELGTDVRQFAYYADGQGHSHYGIPISAGEDAAVDPSIDPRDLFHRYVSYTIDEIGAMYTEKDRVITEALRTTTIPDSSSVGAEYAKALYAHAAESGIDLPTPSPDEMSHLGGNFIFPHFFTLPTLGNALVYRARPIDWQTTEWDVWSLSILPKGEARPSPAPQRVDWHDEDAVGRVLYQDFMNLEEVWKGMQSSACDGLRLNARQEVGLFEMHKALDHVMGVGRT